MKTKRLITKKGIALSTLATLILAGLSFGIVLMVLIQSGLLTNLQSFMATTLTAFESNLRGMAIAAIAEFMAVFILVLFAIMWLGSTCHSGPWGAAACLAMYASLMVFLVGAIHNLDASFPWVDIPNPDINLPPTGGHTCGTDGADPNVFIKEVADRSVDCWYMFAEGRYNPLLGKVPPNPRTCFVINFNLNNETGVSFDDIKNWMKTNNYPGTSDTYWKKSGNGLVLENNKDAFSKRIKTGRMFIKYGDNIKKIWTEPIWGSADCSIRDETFYNTFGTNTYGKAPPSDHIYWCIDEKATKSPDICYDRVKYFQW
jgi:hypothetical protein